MANGDSVPLPGKPGIPELAIVQLDLRGWAVAGADGTKPLTEEQAREVAASAMALLEILHP